MRKTAMVDSGEDRSDRPFHCTANRLSRGAATDADAWSAELVGQVSPHVVLQMRVAVEAEFGSEPYDRRPAGTNGLCQVGHSTERKERRFGHNRLSDTTLRWSESITCSSDEIGERFGWHLGNTLQALLVVVQECTLV